MWATTWGWPDEGFFKGCGYAGGGAWDVTGSEEGLISMRLDFQFQGQNEGFVSELSGVEESR